MNRKLFEYSYSLRKEKKRKFLLVLLYIFLIILIINLIIKFVVFPVKQNSDSMLPDVKEQSMVMVVPLLKHNVNRGDVVLLDSRNNPEKNGFQNFVKGAVAFVTGQQVQLYEDKNFPGTKRQLRRVIGIPGDTIYMRDYVLYVKPAAEKHFLTEFEIIKDKYNVTFYTAPVGWDSSIGVKGSFDEITLGKNEYFVLGDNRKSAADSRLWGPVNGENICGKAAFCYFPFDSMKIY